MTSLFSGSKSKAVGATDFAHLFRMPMVFASNSSGATFTTAVQLKQDSTGALTDAALKPSRGGAADHSPSIGRG